MKNIKGILVTIVAPMENHIANGGEKLLGNASSIKKRNDGRVYVSGQMQRHVLFSAINRLNMDDSAKNGTYVSNGDGIGNAIEVDLRADMGGFMHPSAGNYSGRRTAPLSVTPAVAMNESAITRDLLVRIKVTGGSDSKDQALATKEQSDSDIMLMGFFLDISNLSISKKFSYSGGFHVKTEYVKHVKDDERKRRIKLFLEATRSMTDYANEARNAVSGEPQKVLIVFDNKMSRKACRYFDSTPLEQKNIITELKNRNVSYWIGDDTVENNKKENIFSVDEAYKNAMDQLNSSTLFDPTGGSNKIQTFAQAFPQPAATENFPAADEANTDTSDEQ